MAKKKAKKVTKKKSKKKAKKTPTEPSSEVKEKNTPIIETETGEKKGEVTEQLSVRSEPEAPKSETQESETNGEEIKEEKASTEATDEETEAKANSDTKALIDRAKKIGLTDNQIASYPDAESLKKALDGMSPQTNPDARTKQGKSPKPVVHTEKMPDEFKIESKFEAKFISQSRVQFDEANLQAELRRINRKYGVHEPVKIVKTLTFKPISGLNENNITTKLLVTHFVIFFK